MELILVALRNVFRNPRRTVLNLVAIGLGVMVVLTMKAWIAGFALEAYQTQIDLDTAHIQVLNSGYEDEARRIPLDLKVRDWTAVKAAVAGLPGLAGVGARIDYEADLSNGVTAIHTLVRGVDPGGEASVTTVHLQVKSGTWLTDDKSVVIGSGMARKLGLKVGDQVFLTALDRYGVKNLVDGSVSGIYDSGYGIFDDGVIFTTLKKAQETLALGPGEATRVVLKFDSLEKLDKNLTSVRSALEANGLGTSTGLTVYPWREFAKTLVDTLESRIRILSVLMVILIVLVTVGILNSMSMAVQERYREIGTLRAIGMNRRSLTRMFLAEGFVLGFAGGLSGVVAASVLAWLGLTFGIDVRGFLPPGIPIPLVSVMRPYYPWGDFPLAALAAALVAVVGSFLPARRAGKMVIRDALGSHV